MSLPDAERGIRVRFAPSPSGELHVGGARTALFNHLLKLKYGGSLILRIEDTDPQRSLPGAAERLENDLEWMGIRFDEGPRQGGASAPYFQSQRRHLYKDILSELFARGAVYPCRCPPERLAELRASAARSGAAPRYDRRCRELPSNEGERLLSSDSGCVIRLATPEREKLVISDLVKGRVVFDSSHLDDPILARADGSATALLAAAVDDHLMGITHVIRGEEWLPSTPYQSFICRSMGWKEPCRGHLPLLVTEERTKLSKRRSAATISSLRREGYLPAVLRRYLVSLGRRNLPQDSGYDLESLVELFDIDDYHRGDVVFAHSALTAENARWIRKLPKNELTENARELVEEMIPEARLWDDRRLAGGLELVRYDGNCLRELAQSLSGICDTPLAGERLQRQFPHAAGMLREIATQLRSRPRRWEAAEIKACIDEAGRSLELSDRELYMPLRLALTGSDHGPGLLHIAEWLGREEVVNRLQKASLTDGEPTSDP